MVSILELLPKDILKHISVVGKLNARDNSMWRATCRTIRNLVKDNAEDYRSKNSPLDLFVLCCKTELNSVAMITMRTILPQYMKNAVIFACMTAVPRGYLNILKWVVLNQPLQHITECMRSALRYGKYDIAAYCYFRLGGRKPYNEERAKRMIQYRHLF